MIVGIAVLLLAIPEEIEDTYICIPRIALTKKEHVFGSINVFRLPKKSRRSLKNYIIQSIVQASLNIMWTMKRMFLLVLHIFQT